MHSSIRAPIIQVGAGRSGSTLLARALNRHEKIQFFGESDFLTHRIWSQVVDNSFWYNWARYVDGDPGSAYGALPALTDGERIRHLDTCGASVAAFIHNLFGASDNGIWGFKEIWNGSGSYQIPWSPYRIVFPQATWVHLVRHPVKFAMSAASWNQTAITESVLTGLFADWVGMVRKSRELRDSNRCVELTYESLVEAPERNLLKVFNAVGLDFDKSSLQEFDRSILRSAPNTTGRSMIVDLGDFISSAPDLLKLCDEFGYHTRIQVSACDNVSNTKSPVDLRAMP